MAGCATESTVASFLPDHARNAHGNLAEQNRMVGAQHGADTTKPAGTPFTPTAAPAPSRATQEGAASNTRALLTKHNCLTCHGMDRKVVGPGLEEIARKYAGQADALAYLEKKIVGGGTGVWGPIPMPAQTLPAADAQAIAKWLAEGARK
jgi:cytochrome c